MNWQSKQQKLALQPAGEAQRKLARRRTSLPFEGTAADIWAMGVLSFQLVTGGIPFGSPESSRAEIVAAIQKGEYDTTDLSPAFVEFLGMALHRDAKARASADELLGCSWLFSQKRQPSEPGTIAVTQSEVAQSIRVLGFGETGAMAVRARRSVPLSAHPDAIA